MSQFRTLKKLITIGVISLISTCSLSAFAQNVETAEDAMWALENLQEDLGGLKYFAERIDQGRILVLEKRIQATSKLVKEKGIGTIATLNSYQELVLSFKYSEEFLKSISTQMSQQTVVSVQKRIDNIIKQRGFDETMNSKLVAGILNQIQNLSQQIQAQQISDSLLQWMKQDLSVKVGNALAAARANGDVPSSFQEANSVYKTVSAKYGELYQINPKNPAYNMVTELMGIMEFYKEMATRGARTQEGQ